MKKKPKFKYKNANKQKGILLRSLSDEPYFFRIYGKNGSFKDYEILHHDIDIQILDESAEFLESKDGKEFYLDYSRKVLGQEAKYKRITKKVKSKRKAARKSL
jgi:hypothetical protein